jgi:hypothetical protein
MKNGELLKAFRATQTKISFPAIGVADNGPLAEIVRSVTVPQTRKIVFDVSLHTQNSSRKIFVPMFQRNIQEFNSAELWKLEGKQNPQSGTRPLNKRFYKKTGRIGMFKSLDIQEHMEVVGSDGKHIGTVDHKEGGDRVMLTKGDSKAGGHHHLISIDWVDYVDRKVHLNKPSQKAMVEWQTVA